MMKAWIAGGLVALAAPAVAGVTVIVQPIDANDPDAKPMKPSGVSVEVPYDTFGSGPYVTEETFFNDSRKHMSDFHLRLSSGTDLITLNGTSFFGLTSCKGTPDRPIITQCDIKVEGKQDSGVKPGESFTLRIANGDNKIHIFNFTPTFVPEPGTWVLLIAGFGLVGAAVRRRPTTVGAER